MQNTNKLLSITNLKKYFPIAKSSIFQKEQMYVRANEDISFDIYKGETLGIVGESGCGKSTLGRVILQLYDQTAGTTIYYGRTRAELAPSYVRNTLKNVHKFIAKYEKKKDHAVDLKKQVKALGEGATFYQIQEMNLAMSEAKTAEQHLAKILGGFMVRATDEGAKLLLNEALLEEKQAKFQLKLDDVSLRLESSEKPVKNREALEAKKEKLKTQIGDLQVQIDAVTDEIAKLKKSFSDDPEFARFEEMLDDGIDLARLKYSEMRLLRKDLQIIFQDPYSSLNPRMTIGQIIEEGLVTHKFFRRGDPQMKDYILEIMRKCGLQDYMMHRYPHQFSGGQRQRISIARALAVKPKFVVCDECVSALDVSIQSQIINLLQDLKEKEGLTYMFISHDLSVVRYISDRICVMYLGNVVEFADADTIFRDPRHPYTVALLSSIPTTDPESLKKERILLEGNIPSPIRPPEGCKFHTRCYMACDICKRVPPQLEEIEPGHFLACHFPNRKIDENGNYLFELPKMERKNRRVEEPVQVQTPLQD